MVRRKNTSKEEHMMPPKQAPDFALYLSRQRRQRGMQTRYNNIGSQGAAIPWRDRTLWKDSRKSTHTTACIQCSRAWAFAGHRLGGLPARILFVTSPRRPIGLYRNQGIPDFLL